ncbi:MAG: RHS repeat-associated core domain-containing protein, partial [Saprospiraceae bacterium]
INYTGTGYGNSSPSLFNGNIRQMVTHIKQFGDNPLGYSYRYDQLNRLAHMETWSNNDSLAWDNGGSSLSIYNEDVTYDPNGNILSYLRKGDNTSAPVMDSLSYFYYPGTNQLRQVVDTVGDLRYAMDIDNQEDTSNYSYDGMGNLISDIQSGVTIKWTPFGKVEKVQNDSLGLLIKFDYDAGQNRIKKEVIASGDTSITWYIRDAQGNTLSVYTSESDTLVWKEQYLFGSSRLGAWEPGITWNASNDTIEVPHYEYFEFLQEGWKRYELSNHLGNVLSVVSDRKEKIAFEGSPTCPDDISGFYTLGEYNNHKYYLSYGTLPWADAEADGVAKGGHLVAINDTMEQVFIANSIASIGAFALIGLNDENSEGNPEWSSGESVSFMMDMVGWLPNNASNDYGVIGSWDGKWGWITSGSYQRYIIEIECGSSGVDSIYYEPVVISASDYFPFGIIQEERNFNSENYRFSFQGEEHDPELKGNGNSIHFRFREYDPRIGRFFVVDPLSISYPFYSPYQFSGNRPIDMIELEGLEPVETGKYIGEGAYASQKDENGNACEDTDCYKWVWDGKNWNNASLMITGLELSTLI